jgi:hypothetical protein
MIDATILISLTPTARIAQRAPVRAAGRPGRREAAPAIEDDTT